MGISTPCAKFALYTSILDLLVSMLDLTRSASILVVTSCATIPSVSQTSSIRTPIMESGRVTKPKKTKAARKAEQRAVSCNVSGARETRTKAPMGPRSRAEAEQRNSRARRLHQLTQRPGHGGLTGKGDEQSRRFFSKKIPEKEKPSLGEMDETTVGVMLQLTAEEVDDTGPSYGALREATEKTMMADRVEINGAEEEEGEKDGKVEEDRMTKVGLEQESLGSIGGEMRSDAVGLWKSTCSHRYK